MYLFQSKVALVLKFQHFIGKCPHAFLLTKPQSRICSFENIHAKCDITMKSLQNKSNKLSHRAFGQQNTISFYESPNIPRCFYASKLVVLLHPRVSHAAEIH